MIRRFACLILLLAGFAGVADAQYQWRDARGRMVFSDMPPPAETPADRILRSPRPPAAKGAAAPGANGAVSGGPLAGRSAASGEPATGATAPVSTPASAGGTYKDKAMAFEKRRQERAEEETRAAQAAREAADRARYCGELESQRRTLESGSRILTVGADGERRYLDENARRTRLEENARALADTCKG